MGLRNLKGAPWPYLLYRNTYTTPSFVRRRRKTRRGFLFSGAAQRNLRSLTLQTHLLEVCFCALDALATTSSESAKTVCAGSCYSGTRCKFLASTQLIAASSNYETVFRD